MTNKQGGTRPKNMNTKRKMDGTAGSGDDQLTEDQDGNQSKQKDLCPICKVKIRRVIQVQSCVRMWLARVRYQKQKWAVNRSVLTLQRYTRGWIIRKKYEKEAAKQLQKNRPQSPKSQAPTSPEDKNLEHQDSDYRGYKVRQEWGPALEEKLKKLVEKHIDNQDEAMKALEAEGMSTDEAVMIIQKFWGRHKKRKEEKAAAKEQKRQKQQDSGTYTNSKRMTDLIMFSQQVHMSNQETHKLLRRHKAGVSLEEAMAAPKDYKRPKGFQQIPHAIHEQRKRVAPALPSQSSNARPHIKITSTDNEVADYYDFLQEEMRRAAENGGLKENLWQEKLNNIDDDLKTQNMINQESSDHQLRQGEVTVATGIGIIPPEQRAKTPPTTNMQAAGDLRQMLRSAGGEKRAAPARPSAQSFQPSKEEGGDGDAGPFNFRGMLRKTNYAPTDTIRKRQLKRDNPNGYGSEQQL